PGRHHHPGRRERQVRHRPRADGETGPDHLRQGQEQVRRRQRGPTMNAWKFRHEGSPVASADLPFDQIVQGLVDGKIHVEDEVKGPTDAGWQKFEDHPAFAELVSELEPEEEDHHDEETSLDMNPMIDVALVLLIFFILTTTYTQLQKIIEAAEASQTEGGVKVVPK